MDLSSNTCVALEPLFINGVRAHNRGDVVPTENAEGNGWTDQVAEHGTDEAIEALGFDPYSDPDGVTADDGEPATYDVTRPIEKVLEFVDGDPTRAVQMLEAERARPEKDQRSSLIEQLTKITPAGD